MARASQLVWHQVNSHEWQAGDVPLNFYSVIETNGSFHLSKYIMGFPWSQGDYTSLQAAQAAAQRLHQGGIA